MLSTGTIPRPPQAPWSRSRTRPVDWRSLVTFSLVWFLEGAIAVACTQIAPTPPIRLANLDFFAGASESAQVAIPPLQVVAEPRKPTAPTAPAPLTPPMVQPSSPNLPLATTSPPPKKAFVAQVKPAAKSMTDRLVKAVSFAGPAAPGGESATNSAVAGSARFLTESDIPRSVLARRRMARQLLVEGRKHLARGELVAAQACADRVCELAVDFGRFEDTPKSLEAAIAKAALRQSR